MIPALAAVGLVGSGISAYGTIRAAQASADAQRRQAGIERLVADEILERAEIDQDLVKKNMQKDLGEIVSQFAESNVDVSTGAPLSVMREFIRATNEEIAIANREALFDSSMKRMKAQDLELAARDTEKAGRLAALGSLMSGAGQFGATMR